MSRPAAQSLAWGDLEAWARDVPGAEEHLSRALRAALGISWPHLRLMLYLAGGRTLAAGQASRLLGCTRGNVTALAERLYLRGLLQRRYGTRDRRRVLLSLTPRGERAARQGLAVARAAWEEWRRAHPPRLPAQPDALVVIEEESHAERWLTLAPVPGEGAGSAPPDAGGIRRPD